MQDRHLPLALLPLLLRGLLLRVELAITLLISVMMVFIFLLTVAIATAAVTSRAVIIVAVEHAHRTINGVEARRVLAVLLLKLAAQALERLLAQGLRIALPLRDDLRHLKLGLWRVLGVEVVQDGVLPLRLRKSISFLLLACEKRLLLLSFPYVCPEPALVNG
jgi:hypothetical protein